MSEAPHLVMRPMLDDDRSGVMALCRASLGWREGDPNEAFFRWKHEENPAGTSPAWVAEAPDGTLAGLRVFMRWRFRDGTGKVRSAVRAVDTATHPDWQGQGIFTKLTLAALEDLRSEGVEFIFNTPNDKSRPGYLKMGWVVAGRLPVAIRPSSVGSVRRILRSRAPAEMWSETVNAGVDAPEAFENDEALARLLRSAAPSAGLATERTAEFLRWRYGFGPLRYRVAFVGRNLEDGIVIFRVRRRNEALEATIVDVIVPPHAATRRTLGEIARGTGADYLIMAGSGADGLGTALAAARRAALVGFLVAPKMGPIVTCRALQTAPSPTMGDFDLTLGDIELF